MKTRKSVSKRFKVTRSGKILRRATGQDHALAKKSSKRRLGRRRWVEVSPHEKKVIKKLLKY